jgi:cyclase
VGLLQPDGGWDRSNAGLIASAHGDTSTLVDTLLDLELTASMLTALRQATPTAGRITTVVNTHANGDHCYDNALAPGAEIVASAASATEMAELPASVPAAFMRAAPDMGDLGTFLLDIFGAFHFDGIELVAPTPTFTGQLDLRVGDRPVQLIEIGPATPPATSSSMSPTPERHRRA